MSSRLTQFSLLALFSSALAVPVRPSGSGMPFYNTGNSSDCYPSGSGVSGISALPTGFIHYLNRHGMGRHGRHTARISGSDSMEALGTGVAVGAATGGACAAPTFYTTTTDIVTVTMTGDDSVAPTTAATSAAATSVAEVSSAVATSATATSIAEVTSIAAGSSYVAPSLESSATAAAAASSSPAAAVSADSTVFASSSDDSAATTSLSLQNNHAFPSKATTTTSAVAISSTPVAAISTTPTTTAVATSAATSAKSTGTSAAVIPSTGKRGVAFNDASLVTPFVGQGKISWSYNWGSSATGLSSDIEFIPMLWSPAQASTFTTDAQKAVDAGVSALLGFNEPDLEAQSNLSPAQAAADYKTMMSDKFGGGKVALGAPAVTNGGAPMGLTWLGNFMDACSSCQIDFVPLHWYDSATNIDYFTSYIENAHKQTGKPIWITEFGATGSDDEVNTFLQTVLPWLDSQSYVERYAYFMASDGKLVTGDALSTYGKTYVSYTG